MLALRRSDRGSILLIAIILVIVIVGMAGSYLVIANVQSNRVVEEADRGRARTAAEAGIDHMRAYLLSLVDMNAATVEEAAAGWDTVLGEPYNGTPAWAASPVQITGGSYQVRIDDNNDGDGNTQIDSDETVLLTSAGSTTAGESDVIRCIVTLITYEPSDRYAILTGDDMLIFGSPRTVMGDLGRIHTNEDLLLTGNASISVAASASGTARVVEAPGEDVQIGSDGTDLPAEGQVPVTIAPVDPTMYRPYANYILTESTVIVERRVGHRLVPTEVQVGQVRDRTGAVVYTFDSGAAAPYNGFTWSSAGGWTTVPGGPYVNGMYYVEGSINFNHGGTTDGAGVTTPWDVTIVATGDIITQGNPTLTPYYNNAELFVAGGDVYMRGTGSGVEVQGMILAHEQVDMNGNVHILGRLVAESAENRAGSRVDSVDDPTTPLNESLLCSFGGNVMVTYNDTVRRSFVTSYQLPVRSWSEDVITNTSGTGGGGLGPLEPGIVVDGGAVR